MALSLERADEYRRRVFDYSVPITSFVDKAQQNGGSEMLVSRL